MSGPKRKPILHSDHWEIPLTKGLSAIVDLDCPSEILSKNWCAHPGGRTSYAARRVGPRGDSFLLLLHRVVMGLGKRDGGPDLDHVNMNGLDCRRTNLRRCTHLQNHQNRRSMAGSTSRFRGVSWIPGRGKWRALCSWREHAGGERKRKYLGYFTDESEAARAYDAFAATVFDLEFFRPNFQTGGT